MRKTRLFVCIVAVTLAGFLAARSGSPVSAQPADAKKPRREVKPRAPKPEPRKDEPAAGGEAGHMLTKKDINRIRYMELKTLRVNKVSPERVQSRVPRDVMLSFLKDMQGRDPETGPDAEWTGKEDYLKASPDMKLAILARFSDDKYIDQIEIRTDPEVFVVFKNKVMPALMNGCATSHCHGGIEAEKTGLRLFNDPKKSAEALYTNFLAIDQTQIDHGKGEESRRFYMFDRSRQEDSLLLAWLLSPDKLPSNGPHHPGEVKIKPVFHSKDDRGYQLIEDWIGSLRKPHPDYGVKIPGKGAAASAPADADEMKP